MAGEEVQKLCSAFDWALDLIFDHVVRQGWKAPYFLDVTDTAGQGLVKDLKVWTGIGGLTEGVRRDEPSKGAGSFFVGYSTMESAAWPLAVHLEEACPSDGGGMSPDEFDHLRTFRWRKLDLVITPELVKAMASVHGSIWGGIRDTNSNEERRLKAGKECES